MKTLFSVMHSFWKADMADCVIPSHLHGGAIQLAAAVLKMPYAAEGWLPATGVGAAGYGRSTCNENKLNGNDNAKISRESDICRLVKKAKRQGVEMPQLLTKLIGISHQLAES